MELSERDVLQVKREIAPGLLPFTTPSGDILPLEKNWQAFILFRSLDFW